MRRHQGITGPLESRPPARSGGVPGALVALFQTSGLLGTFEGVVADILGPAADQLFEGLQISLIESSCCLFVVRSVAGHCGQEATESFTYAAGSLFARLGLDRLFDEATESAGDPTRLGFEPLPVAREEGDLAARDTKLGSAGTAHRERRLSLQDFVEGTAQIEVDLATCFEVEDEREIGAIFIEALFEDGEHFAERSEREAPGPGEGGIEGRCFHGGNITRVKLVVNITRVIFDEPALVEAGARPLGGPGRGRL